MVRSDNVVRAGLTPKLIDTDTLVNMLEYRCGPAKDRKFAGEKEEGSGITDFNPPVPDFAVKRIEVYHFFSNYIGGFFLGGGYDFFLALTILKNLLPQFSILNNDDDFYI